MSDRLWRLFGEHEAECRPAARTFTKAEDKARFPVLAAYDQVLKCSQPV